MYPHHHEHAAAVADDDAEIHVWKSNLVRNVSGSCRSRSVAGKMTNCSSHCTVSCAPSAAAGAGVVEVDAADALAVYGIVRRCSTRSVRNELARSLHTCEHSSKADKCIEGSAR